MPPLGAAGDAPPGPAVGPAPAMAGAPRVEGTPPGVGAGVGVGVGAAAAVPPPMLIGGGGGFLTTASSSLPCIAQQGGMGSGIRVCGMWYVVCGACASFELAGARVCVFRTSCTQRLSSLL